MLDVRPENLLAEIEAAEKLRDAHLQNLDAQIDRFTGPSWDSQCEWSSLNYDPKNRGFQYVRRILSRVAFDNPRFTITSRAGPAQRAVAQAMRLGMNRWARDVQLQEIAEHVATDSRFAYGVLAVTQVPDPMSDPGAEEPRMRPQMRRLSPREYGFDSIAKNRRDARFEFNIFVIDKDDLLVIAEANKDEGWDVKAINALAPDTGKEKLVRPKSDNQPTREEIVAYSIWVPEYEIQFGEKEAEAHGAGSWKEAGYHGTIFTLGVGQGQSGDDSGEWIRAPQPYYGPASGPYQVIGSFYVPDSAIPLGELTAVEGQNQELNIHARAMTRSAARRKNMALVGANDTALQAAVKSAEDGDVVTCNVADLAKNLAKVELGGVTDEQRMTILDLEADLDRALGTSDAVQGSVTGDATATENMIAAQASSSQEDWTSRKFRYQFGLACQKVAWFLYHDDRVSFPLGDEASAELNVPEPWFQGGTQAEGSGASFEDLELEIEIDSMARPDEAREQAQTMQFMAAVEQLVGLVVQFPNAGFDRWIPILAEKFNQEAVADALNLQGLIADALMAQMVGMAPPQPGAGATQPQPRLAGDVGLPRQVTRGMAGGIASGGPPKKGAAANPKQSGIKRPAMAGAV